MNFRLSNTVRRLVTALAAAQLAMTVAVPLAEARLERAPGPVSVEQRHTEQCVTIHRPGACVLCQHAATRAQQGRSSPLPVAGRETLFVARRLAQHAPVVRPGFPPPTRAPPAISA